MSKATQVSWDEFRALICQLANSIDASGFRPDLLIAIARGGWVPTRYLSDLLGVDEIASIGLRYTDPARAQLALYSFPEPIQTHRRVLIVEDVLESGKTLAKAKEVTSLKAATVRTACLYYRPEVVLKPDYSLGVLDETLAMPWEDRPASSAKRKCSCRGQIQKNSRITKQR